MWAGLFSFQGGGLAGVINRDGFARWLSSGTALDWELFPESQSWAALPSRRIFGKNALLTD
jgi:hypothetical protein